ncbi:MAG: hypothetical protein E7479_00895 [Ruminococcaceae bacterium]|nr:hypothetical protein [Oscillospiraceae bacterium]
MDNLKNVFEKIKKYFKKNKKIKALLIPAAGFIGIVMILFSEAVPEKESINSNEDKTPASEISEREKILENRIGEAVSKIKGAGKTHVTITFESSEETFYAKNFSGSTGEKEKENQEEIVIIDGKNGEEPIYLKTDEAKIRGVLVICEGGGNPLVKEKIIEGICALLDISSNKVSVAEMAK